MRSGGTVVGFYMNERDHHNNLTLTFDNPSTADSATINDQWARDHLFHRLEHRR